MVSTGNLTSHNRTGVDISIWEIQKNYGSPKYDDQERL